MDKEIKEIEKLYQNFLQLREQASVRKEHFRGVDIKKEAEMQGYALAYTFAAGKIAELIKRLENL